MHATKIHHRTTCRLCDSSDVHLVLNLEPIPLSENYCSDLESAIASPRYSVDVSMCAQCGHVQQLEVVDSNSLWSSYTYFTSEAKGMPEHLGSVAAQIIFKYTPKSGSLIIDIGSNDGTLLRPFKSHGHKVLGIDPAKEIARIASLSGIETVSELMSLDLARDILNEHGSASVICMFNAFAHADNLNEIAESIQMLLSDEGVFVFECQYLMDIIDQMLIASIFHEHISHHSVLALYPFFHRHNLELIDIKHYPTIQHGSIVGFVQRKGGPRKIEPSVDEFMLAERERALDTLEPLRQFASDLDLLRKEVGQLIISWNSKGLVVAGYGAARSGPTIIAQFGLSDVIKYIFDDHPQKVGRYSSGDGIPIVPTDQLLLRMPDITVILAWVHSHAIVAANQEYLANGGRFFVVCPNLFIVDRHGIHPVSF
jgi:SAM-dependent methyltransferase